MNRREFLATAATMTAAPPLSPDLLRTRVWPFLTPADWNRTFLKHYGFGVTPAADFHAILSADLHDLHRRRGSRRAYIAPRGGAKSTQVTLAYALRCAVQGWEPHILILSDSDEQAAQHLGAVKAELEINRRLANGYPAAVGPGPEWTASKLRLPNGVLIEAMGKGVRLRGRRNRQSRPSLIVLDDVQSNRDIVSAVERERTWNWFTKEVLPAGDERTNFLSVGTALHREAVSIRAIGLPGWNGRSFRAVHSWPDRLDLWERWELLATNLADADREKTAAAFFEDHRAEMSAGFRGYWESKWPVDRMMAKRAEVGRSAFDSEYQGNPASPEGAVWPAEYFDWTGDDGRPGIWFDEWPDGLVVKVQALDPSQGAGIGSDYQGHVWGGVVGDGTIYLDAGGYREDPTRMVRRALQIARQFSPLVLVAEANNTMGLLLPEFDRQFQDARQAGQPVMVNYEEVIHSDPKPTRIQVAGGYLSRKQIRVRNTPGGRMLVEQWRDFPGGAFDDLPDAAGSCLIRMGQLVNGG